MSYEHQNELQRLENTLFSLESLIDDRKTFESDPENIISKIHLFLIEGEEILDSIVQEDPEIPVSWEDFFKRSEVLKSLRSVSDYPQFESFSVDFLPNFKKEIAQFTSVEEEKLVTLDNLSIPVMSVVNHQPHPTRVGYLVYHFKVKEHAEYFENQLQEKDLFYERFDEVIKGETIYWFGVREQDYDAVEVLNYTTKGRFRQPLIKDKAARYVIVGFGVIVVIVAIIGAIMSNS